MLREATREVRARRRRGRDRHHQPTRDGGDLGSQDGPAPIHPAIVWQDRRTADVCAALKAEGHEPRVTEVTGLLLDPYFSGTKIAWVLDKVPGARGRAEAGELLAGTMDAWVIWKPHGRRGSRHRRHQRLAHPAVRHRCPGASGSSEMLDLFNVPGALLPKVLRLRRRLRRQPRRRSWAARS
ncbi:FGGY family carbohydrate kinase [Caulobacter segnis]